MNRPQQIGKIHLLTGDVVSRIAAGEVVERPASVVKELLDNSLDAGGTRITVDIEQGGLTRIQVQDNGEGMRREDALLAFHRHATSKVTSDRDLGSIQTMGFRGEALPSIASVSKVRMVTYDGACEVGTQVDLSGGEVEKVEDTVAPQGTTVVVEQLFFNTPARKKFLKTPATEFSHISHVVQQASLAWPGIHFLLRHNGHEVLQFPSVSNSRDRVLQVYQRRFVDQCLNFSGEGAGFSFLGLMVNPLQVRSGRMPQDLFVNRRPVKNGMIVHAVYEGYESFLPKGRHPRFVFFLDIRPSLVDVNVHPAKREVRFLDQDPLHREVCKAVKTALGGSYFSEDVLGTAGQNSTVHPSVQSRRNTEVEAGYAVGEQRPVSWPSADLTSSAVSDQAASVASGRCATSEPTRVVPLRLGADQEIVPFGQLHSTFLVVQVGSELQVLDQHTAHERVIFERLKREWAETNLASQPLLIADPIDLSPQAGVVLRQHVPRLERLGLLIEPFGPSSFLVRGVPATLGHFDYVTLVQDLVEDLEEWKSLSSWEEKIRPILATLACHSAVRAGRQMGLSEIKRLAEDWVQEGLPMTCPHGRRTALRLPADDLAKIFGR